MQPVAPEVKLPRNNSCVTLWTEHPESPFHYMAYSEARGFFEPITNLSAEPLIGKITAWEYELSALAGPYPKGHKPK